MHEMCRGVKTPWYRAHLEVNLVGIFLMKKPHNVKKPTLGDAGKGKPVKQSDPIIVSDDRLGSNEPLDEANAKKGESPDFAAGVDEIQSSDHRIRKIEVEDEHTNEVLIEEGLQGRMKGSLTKPRKTN